MSGPEHPLFDRLMAFAEKALGRPVILSPPYKDAPSLPSDAVALSDDDLIRLDTRMCHWYDYLHRLRQLTMIVVTQAEKDERKIRNSAKISYAGEKPKDVRDALIETDPSVDGANNALAEAKTRRAIIDDEIKNYWTKLKNLEHIFQSRWRNKGKDYRVQSGTERRVTTRRPRRPVEGAFNSWQPEED